MKKIYSKDLRERVVDYVERGNSKVEASRVFKVCRRTIYYWLKLKKTRGNLLHRKPLGVHSTIDENKLRAYLEVNSDAYLYELAEIFNVSSVAIFNALKRYKISYKKNTSLRRAKRARKGNLPTGNC
jgi:putative transposase